MTEGVPSRRIERRAVAETGLALTCANRPVTASTQKEGGPALHRPSSVNQEVAGSSPARGANQSCRLQNVGGDREIHADVLLTVSLGAPLTMVENPATSRQI